MKHITQTDLNGIPIVVGQVSGDALTWNGTNWIQKLVISNVLTGFSAGAGTVTSSDTILTAINKITGNIAALATWNLNGNTVGSEKWIGTVDNYALPFRTNNTEVARFNVTGGFGLGVSPIASTRLSVQGSGSTSATYGLKVQNSSATQLFNLADNGQVGFGSAPVSTNAFTITDIQTPDSNRYVLSVIDSLGSELIGVTRNTTVLRSPTINFASLSGIGYTNYYMSTDWTTNYESSAYGGSLF